MTVDAAQAAALAHRGPLLRVLGGPGTGKTRLAVEFVAQRVADGSLSAEQCLLLAASRRSAARLRDAVTARVGATTREPLARTLASFGFGLVRRAAVAADRPTPRLLTGPEQDVVLRELLAGHLEEPAGAPRWPDDMAAALTTRGFRAELRDLLMRAVEHGVDPAALAALGSAQRRPEWLAAAHVFEEYDQVTALSRPGAFDPAWIVTGAADALEDEPGLIDGLRAEVRLVVVDDAQEVGAAGARLLRLLAQAGIEMVLLGDPDCAVQTFRGADPRFLGDGWRTLGDGATVRLTSGHRLPAVLAGVAARVVPLIGAAAGIAHRGAPATRPGGAVGVHLFRSAAAEAGFIADAFRRAHLLKGQPWNEMAVIVRGRGRAAAVRRVLTCAHVPVADDAAELPVAGEEAVRPLLTLLRAAFERVAARAGAGQGALAADPDAGWVLDPPTTVDLLTSPYAGCDAVTLRRLRRGLRRDALTAGAAPPADHLLAAAIAQPGRLLPLGAEADGARRLGRMLEAATTLVEQHPDAGPEDVLWELWSSAGLAETWRARALTGGRAGARADRDLDAVIGLFAAAADFTDRLPGIGAKAFWEHLAAQDLAADSIAARSPADQRVQVLTPHAAAGREWRLVAVAGVQEGSWPDLRLRGSLLGSEHLVDVLHGRERSIPAAQAAVRHDEARLFHVAVTRASERLLVSAVRSEDEQPSPYLEIIDPRPEGQPRPFTEVDRPLTLVGTVAGLRRAAATPGAEFAGPAATLAVLANAGVRGADPGAWWAMRAASGTADRVPEGQTVRVSPSGLVDFERCQLRWLLSRLGGEGPSVGSAALGTLIHEVIAGGDADADELSARLDGQWSRLGLGQAWTGRARRADADAMVRRAAAYFAAAERDGWRRVGAELQLRLALGRAEIIGTVDRLETDAQGAVRVVDFKTGRSKPKGAEVARHPQLGCYQAAVSAGAFGPAPSAGAALVHVGKAGGTGTGRSSVQVQPPLERDEDPEWAGQMVAAAASAMAGSRVTACAGDWCRTCVVRTSCPVVPEGVMLA
ncbi:MAG: ATP-dependent DNA helicase [Tetrasphaera sp.]